MLVVRNWQSSDLKRFNIFRGPPIWVSLSLPCVSNVMNEKANKETSKKQILPKPFFENLYEKK